MTVELEDRLRDVLDRQAAALDVPAWHPRQGPASARIGSAAAEPTGPRTGAVARLPLRPGTGRAPLWLASAAAVLLVVGAGVVVQQGLLDRPGSGIPGDGPVPEAHRSVSIRTPQVELEAESITVDVNGRRFQPIGDVDLNSDPGDAGYTTLEMTWFEDGIEMRINLYVAADPTHWWITEMRTYDGHDPGEWITQVGDRYRTPRGQPYEGDIGFGPLRMTGVRLTVNPGP